MADILIRGMEIDGRHHKALFTEKDGRPVVIVETALSYDERNVKVYPIAEIKTPYGRLIDADALFEKMYHLSDNEGAHKDSRVDDALILRDSACYLIDDAPTIVPAEGGGKGG